MEEIKVATPSAAAVCIKEGFNLFRDIDLDDFEEVGSGRCFTDQKSNGSFYSIDYSIRKGPHSLYCTAIGTYHDDDYSEENIDEYSCNFDKIYEGDLESVRALYIKSIKRTADDFDDDFDDEVDDDFDN